MSSTEMIVPARDTFALRPEQSVESTVTTEAHRFVIRPENIKNRKLAIAEFENAKFESAEFQNACLENCKDLAGEKDSIEYSSSSKTTHGVPELLFYARKLIASSETQTAIHLVRQALNLDSRHPEALKTMLSCLGSDPATTLERLKILETLVNVDPSFDSYAALGKCLAESARYDAAMDAYFEANLRVKDDGSGLFEVFKDMGNIAVRRGDFEQAEEFYHKAFTLNPDSDVLQVNLGTLSIQKSDWGEAILRFRRALEISPASDKAWVGMALCHHQLGDGAMARATIENAMDINPANRTAVHLYASWSLAMGLVPQATQRLEEYLSMQESDSEMSLVLIHLFCHAGQIDLAKLEIERAICFDPTREDLLALYEQLHQKVGA